jgi:hypothetical protein
VTDVAGGQRRRRNASVDGRPAPSSFVRKDSMPPSSSTADRFVAPDFSST